MAETTFSSAALRAALEKATDDLKQKVRVAQSKAASLLVSRLLALYPNRTGRMRRGVRKLHASTFGFIVRSNAPHVHFLEAGTRERFDNTRRNARRGRVGARPIFVPSVKIERAAYVREVQAVLDKPVEL